MNKSLLACCLLVAILFTASRTSAQIWSDNFSNPSNWTVGHQAGTQGDWIIGSFPLGFVGAVASASGGLFAGFDSDALGQGTTNNAWITTANPINVSSLAQVEICWTQSYQRFQDDVYIEVSTNGATWTTYAVNTNVGTNQATPNPDFRTLDISATAALQPSVWIRFRYVGAWDYGWAIDDVCLTSPANNDLSLDTSYFNTTVFTDEFTYYAQIPLNQASFDTLRFAGVISNSGNATQTNTQLTVDVAGPITYQGSSPTGTTLNFGASASFDISGAAFIPAQLGDYAVTFAAISDSLDEIPTNDTIIQNFTVNDTVYARDYDDFTGGISYAAGTDVHQMAVLYEFNAPDTITSMAIYLFNNGAAGTTDGAVINFHIYDNNFTPIASVNFVTIDNTWFNQWVTVPFPPTAVPPGTYLAGYETLNPTEEVWIAIGDNPVVSPANASFVNVGNSSWGWIENTPFIRVHVAGFPPDSCSFLNQSASILHESCAGASDGLIDISISGANGPVTYAWSNGQLTQDLAGLSPATYTLVVTDSLGCTDSVSYQVTGPDTLAATSAATALDYCGQSSGTAISGGTAGTPPYSYLWSSGDTTDNADSLSSGTHTVTVTDANNCSLVDTVLVNDTTYAVGTSITSTNEVCPWNNGTATVAATSGVSPYSLLWSNGQTTATATGLTAGIITLSVLDANGCTGMDSTTIVVDSAILSVSVTVTDENCSNADGTALATITNGAPPYSVLWNTGQSDTTLFNLAAGTVSVLVTDSLGCIASDSSIIANLDLQLSVMVADDTCTQATGSVVATASGAVMPYTYSWSDSSTGGSISALSPGSYSVTITSQNGCVDSQTVAVAAIGELLVTLTSVNPDCGSTNGAITAFVTAGISPFVYQWSTTGQTTSTATGLAPGTHAVTVSDAGGCSAVYSATLNTIGGPAVSVASTAVSCFGSVDGSAMSTVTGGTTPYAYLWPNNTTNPSASGFSAGTYDLFVTDADSCVTVTAFTIGTPAALAVSVSTMDAGCGAADGEIALTLTGGNAPFLYSWDAAAGNQATSTATGLTFGGYTCTITDAMGCFEVVTAQINNPGVGLTAVVAATPVTCFGWSNGAASVAISGGTVPYSYLWSTGSPQATVNGLPSGQIAVTVTDQQGCSISASNVVAPGALVTLSFTELNPLCFGTNTGSIAAAAASGQAPYTYHWSSGQNSSLIANIAAGTYTVTATDQNGCQVFETITLTDPPAVVTAPIIGEVRAIAGSTSIYWVTEAAGSSYNWSVSFGSIQSGQGSDSISVEYTGPGHASVTVVETDSNGCVGDTVFLEVNIDPSGIHRVSEQASQLTVYPNPSRGDVSIVLPNAHERFTLQLVTLTGTVLREQTAVSGNQIIVERGNLAAGTYLIVLRGKEAHRGTLVLE